MQNHPLTPMTDPDIRRWLKPQTNLKVGHVAAATVFEGAHAISAALDAESEAGQRLIVVDALQDEDLLEIGQAANGLPLITGGSGVALGLPANFRRKGKLSGAGAFWTGQEGKCVALSGSCSNATRAQVTLHAKDNPALEIVASDVIEKRLTAEQVAEWLLGQDGIPLAFSSADPEILKSVQEQYGRETSAEAIENLFAEVARLVVSRGVTRILTAGGETSGAVVEGLGLNTLEIGPEIDPGVPALRAGPNLTVALKSGNFGAPDFFAKAANILAGQ